MTEDRNITGGRELDAFMQTLSAKVEKNIMRSALAAGARVIRTAAQQNVPEELGELKRSIRVTTKAVKGTVSASVKAGSKKAFYWRFVEFGTAPHVINPKNGNALVFGGGIARSLMHPGARAKPFLRPALDSAADAALAAVAEQIKKRLTLAGINTNNPEPE
ncbi:MAG: HK97-gp10 family putative phage morphogenesis protein [Pseudomonadota bacterium]